MNSPLAEAIAFFRLLPCLSNEAIEETQSLCNPSFGVVASTFFQKIFFLNQTGNEQFSSARGLTNNTHLHDTTLKNIIHKSAHSCKLRCWSTAQRLMKTIKEESRLTCVWLDDDNVSSSSKHCDRSSGRHWCDEDGIFSFGPERKKRIFFFYTKLL